MYPIRARPVNHPPPAALLFALLAASLAYLAATLVLRHLRLVRPERARWVWLGARLGWVVLVGSQLPKLARARLANPLFEGREEVELTGP